jgi:hypothetical protein
MVQGSGTGWGNDEAQSAHCVGQQDCSGAQRGLARHYRSNSALAGTTTGRGSTSTGGGGGVQRRGIICNLRRNKLAVRLQDQQQ